MTDYSRREVLKTLAATLPVLTWTQFDVDRAVRLTRVAQAAPQGYQPRFFTGDEWRTVQMLVDIIIPRDPRAGSATDAGVPEFMDFMMMDSPGGQTPMRGGLAWLDTECHNRFGRTFVDCTDAQRTELLDVIAYPDRAPAELSHGVAFFTRFRDLTASGYWSSQMGVQDLQYMGNTAVPVWTGCPDEQLRKLGVRYDG